MIAERGALWIRAPRHDFGAMTNVVRTNAFTPNFARSAPLELAD